MKNQAEQFIVDYMKEYVTKKQKYPICGIGVPHSSFRIIIGKMRYLTTTAEYKGERNYRVSGLSGVNTGIYGTSEHYTNRAYLYSNYEVPGDKLVLTYKKDDFEIVITYKKDNFNIVDSTYSFNMDSVVVPLQTLIDNRPLVEGYRSIGLNSKEILDKISENKSSKFNKF